MPPRQLRLHTLRLSALPFFRSLLDGLSAQVHSLDLFAGLYLSGGALPGDPPHLQQVCVVGYLEGLPCVLLNQQ